MVYWLRMSRATSCAMVSTSVSSLGKNASPPVASAKRLQFALRLLGVAAVFFAQQAHGVDQHAALLRNLDQILQADDAALSTPSVTTTSTFLSRCAFFFQMIDRHADARRAWRCRRANRCAPGLPSISSISLVKSFSCGRSRYGVSLKLTTKTFVVFVRCQHQIERGLFHLLALLPHAAAVIDNQAQRNRHVFALEQRDVLRLAVLKNREGGFRQVGHQMAVLIDDGSGASDPPDRQM